EAFVVALRDPELFEQQDVGKWLRGIARNLVRNEIRKDARRRRILHEGFAELLLKDADCHDDDPYWQRARLSHLRDCVEQLPPKSREIVTGRYSDGWNATDLADHLSMTAAAVRQALMRIRQQLKVCVEQQTIENTLAYQQRFKELIALVLDDAASEKELDELVALARENDQNLQTLKDHLVVSDRLSQYEDLRRTEEKYL
ncbi:unnamed protein product, partial [Symbiodinium sp. CCMP2456]